MLYLDVTVKEWLAKYPQLLRASLNVCADYELKLDDGKPFVTKNKIGVSFERCEALSIKVKANRP